MKLDRGYVSDIDNFLKDFDKKHEKSLSQLQEIAKHERIFKLRDDPNAERVETVLWQDF